MIGLGEITYVALGDSNTAGDQHVGRGARWADLLAGALGAAGRPVEYHNLAVYGVKTAEVAAVQLPLALELHPDLITLVCGINDVLMSPDPPIDEYRRLLGEMVEQVGVLRPAPTIVTATIPDLTRFVPYRPRSRARVSAGFRRLGEATRALARERGLRCVDLAAHAELHVRESFGPDGYHPSPRGHRAMAEAFFDVLGVAAGESPAAEAEAVA